MAFRYNTSIGKLSPSSPQLAYNPDGLQKLKAEPPPIQWAVKPVQPRPPYSPRIRVYEKFPLFQAKDGVPIHLKRGARDRIAFAFTAGYVICSCGYALFQLGKLINKK